MYIRGKSTSSAQAIEFNLSGVIVYYPPTIVVYVHCVLLCLWCHNPFFSSVILWWWLNRCITFQIRQI